MTQGWKFNKEVSIADIVSIILAAGAGFAAYTNLSTRLAILEDRQINQTKNDQRQDEEQQRGAKKLEDSIAQINMKLDRLIERRP